MSEQGWQVLHNVDVCVVGGGLAGMCAAISAARHGAKVALMQDRPVLGGNGSSEIRMHVCGADRHNTRKNMRETGLVDEMRMENLYRNPTSSYAIWDTVLYEHVRFEPNITMLLNCSCLDATANDGRVETITGWQLTTYTRHIVRAKIFIDCSGDGILAPLVGADFRMGREGRSEYNEPIAPLEADEKTMGLTLMFKAIEHPTPQTFVPPKWAYKFTSCDDLPDRHTFQRGGFWWLELGGEQNSIRDTETIRDELLRLIYGVWDHIKNHCVDKDKAANLALDWLQFLPGKRESRRYIGDHVMTQHDIEAGGNFDDVVAYGGWSMDDHSTAGFWCKKRGETPTIFHPAPSPYGIAYRTLYSRNIENLMFAGRVHSATHSAMSSTRVMATCAVMGQAAGTAAAMAIRLGITPRGVNQHMHELQQTLLRDDCYLPGVKQEFSALTTASRVETSQGDGEVLRNGLNRPIGEQTNRWDCQVGDWAGYVFDSPRQVAQVSLIVDSAMDKDPAITQLSPTKRQTVPPDVMPRTFRIEMLRDGQWQEAARVDENYQRLVRVPLGQTVSGVRFVLESTWGSQQSGLYAMYLE